MFVDICRLQGNILVPVEVVIHSLSPDDQLFVDGPVM